jgi:tRNA 2-thiouridine synthesizing protein A
MNDKWDAGDTGCGRLAFELHLRMRRLRPGDTLEITALDPGASTDLPAWCRMTGNVLVRIDPPIYVIQRKAD